MQWNGYAAAMPYETVTYREKNFKFKQKFFNVFLNIFKKCPRFCKNFCKYFALASWAASELFLLANFFNQARVYFFD